MQKEVTRTTRPNKYLLNVSQRLGVPAQLLALLLVVEAGVGARQTVGFRGRDASQGTERGVEDHLVVPDQELHHERLVGVVHQGGEGDFRVRLPRFDERRTKDDAQVAGRHLVLLRLLRHPGGSKGEGYRLADKHSN